MIMSSLHLYNWDTLNILFLHINIDQNSCFNNVAVTIHFHAILAALLVANMSEELLFFQHFATNIKYMVSVWVVESDFRLNPRLATCSLWGLGAVT